MRRERWIGANGVGRVNIEIDVANNDDVALARRGKLPKNQVRRQTIGAVVDSGATTVLPGKVVKGSGCRLQARSRSATPTVERRFVK
jgi:hypothetical protein